MLAARRAIIIKAMLVARSQRYRLVSRNLLNSYNLLSRVSPFSALTHQLVVAILKEVEFVDHCGIIVEHDVRGATIAEARGMAEHLAAYEFVAGFKVHLRRWGTAKSL